MSGIAGLMRVDGGPVGQDDINRMLAPLLAYGPDRHDTLLDGSVGLAHALMRMTPEDTMDRQPLTGPSGNILVADVRLDNRAELAAALGISAAELLATADSALIMAAYERWRDDCVSRLLGSFAFVVWDRRERRLFCARDHVGEYSFHYHRGAGFFAFASSENSLLALPAVPRRLNEQKLAEHLVLLHSDMETTFNEDIYRLPAAHVMTVAADGAISKRRYWWPDSLGELNLRSDAAYEEAFREVFDEAVSCRLRSRHPIAVTLSGGLDSSSVACVAAQMLKKRDQRLTAFSAQPREGFRGAATPKGRIDDERPFIEATCSKAGNIDVHYLETDGDSVLADAERSFKWTGKPPRNPINSIWIENIYREAKAHGTRVLLTGESGNMTISYNGFADLPYLFKSGQWIRLQKLLGHFARANDISWSRAFVGHVLFRLTPVIVFDIIQKMRGRGGGEQPWTRHSAIHPAFAEEIKLAERFKSLGADPRYRFTQKNGAGRRLWHLLQGAGVDGADRHQSLKSGYGVERRDPTADKRVIEFCLTIPAEQWLKDGINRSLVRRSMEGCLPPSVQWNTLRGLQATDWYLRMDAARGELRRELDWLRKNQTARRLLDLDRLQRLLDNWPTEWAVDRTLPYRLVLARGLTVGRFIRWHQGNDEAPDSEIDN